MVLEVKEIKTQDKVKQGGIENEEENEIEKERNKEKEKTNYKQKPVISKEYKENTKNEEIEDDVKYSEIKNSKGVQMEDSVIYNSNNEKAEEDFESQMNKIEEKENTNNKEDDFVNNSKQFNDNRSQKTVKTNQSLRQAQESNYVGDINFTQDSNVENSKNESIPPESIYSRKNVFENLPEEIQEKKEMEEEQKNLNDRIKQLREQQQGNKKK